MSWHKPLSSEIVGTVMPAKFAEYMPNHKPLWTCVQTEMLGGPHMLVEIEVIAHVSSSPPSRSSSSA